MRPQRPFDYPKSWEDTCLEEQAQDRKSKQQGNHLIAPSSSNAYRQNVRELRSGDQALCRSTVVISWGNLGHILEFQHFHSTGVTRFQNFANSSPSLP